MYMAPLPHFTLQLHRGLKTVDIQAQSPVQLGELPMRSLSREPVIADHLAHHCTVFLLNETLVVTVLRASPREGDVLSLTIGQQVGVDELTPVVGIESQNGKRQQLAHPLECLNNR